MGPYAPFANAFWPFLRFAFIAECVPVDVYDVELWLNWK